MNYFIVFLLLFIQFENPKEEWLIDFGTEQSREYWSVTVDGVMGGLSTGRSTLTDSSLVFTGDVSLKNNGGFSSIRSQYGRYNMAQFDSVQIRMRVTGQRFSFTMSKDSRWWVANYKKELSNYTDGWEVHSMAIDSFDEYRVGNPTGRKISEGVQSRIIRMGFINEGKKEGPFKMEIDYIRFF